jgi:transposase InsO family protein
VTAVCTALGVGRATAYRGLLGRPRRYVRPDDATVLAQIRAIVRTRGSYGYRRVTVLVNRTFGTRYNRKRIQRLMQLSGLVLARRRRLGRRRPHHGRIIRLASNERWCSDALEIACWDGTVVRVAFVLDCHDRECLSWIAEPRPLTGADVQRLLRAAIAARFGTTRAPSPCEWLTDNGGIFTALPTVLVAEQLGLVPITTPVASPESNGMAEAFVQTLRRDYLDGAELTGPAVLAALPAWLQDYNTEAPHSGLAMLSPAAWRARQQGTV